MSKIVFLAPHFDDMELAAGATIAKFCEQGHEVIEIAMTDSEEGHSGNYNAEEKRKQGISAATILGLKKENVYSKARLFEEILFKADNWSAIDGEGRRLDCSWLTTNSQRAYSYSTNAFGEVHRVWHALFDMRLEENGSTVVQTVMKIVRFFKPDVVMSVTEDFHCDHRAMGKYVKEGVYQACRRGISGSIEEFREPLVLSSGVDMERPMNYVPQIYSEITKEQIEKKIAALQNYPDFMSEHSSNAKSIFTNEMGRDWCWSVARLRGMESCSKTGLAEAFRIDNLKLMLPIESIL